MVNSEMTEEQDVEASCKLFLTLVRNKIGGGGISRTGSEGLLRRREGGEDV